VLANTKASKIATGKNAGQVSQVKFETDQKVLATTQAKVAELLSKYPLYPGLDF